MKRRLFDHRLTKMQVNDAGKYFILYFFSPSEKIVLRARSKLPHLSLNHLKSLLGRKCLLPLINLPDFDMNYLTPDISSDRDNLPIHET